MTAVFAGCQDSSSTDSGTSTSTSTNGEAASGEKSYRIAVIPKGTTHEFWKSVHAGAENAAKELGNVKILWKGPLQENDRDGQISVVQDFITKQVDGICLAPLDSQALIEYVEEAAEENVPVVIFDSGLDDESNIVTYVATDNYQGGVLAGKRMGELLEGKGNVILLRYIPGSQSTTQREEGFLETLKKDYPNIKILSSNEYSGATPESSLDKATQLLGKFKDQVNGVFAVCEPNATGTLGALEELELDKKVIFVGFDPNTPLIEGMKNKQVHGIVLQDPVTMGYQAVMAMVQHLEGKEVEKRIGTGEYLATPENMNEAHMDKLLKPQQFGEE